MFGPPEIDPFSGVSGGHSPAPDPFDGGMWREPANPYTGLDRVNPFVGPGGGVVPVRADPRPDAEAMDRYYQVVVHDGVTAGRVASAPSPSPKSPEPRGPVVPDKSVHELSPAELAKLVARFAQYDAELAKTSAESKPPPPPTPPPSRDPAPPSSRELPPHSPSSQPSQPTERRPVAEPDWTTRTEWAYTPPDRRLIQPITHYESGNRALNFLMNKVVLPWRNAFAFAENLALGTIIGIDAEMKSSPFAKEYEAAQDMMPLEGAMGLGLEAGPALDYAVAWLATETRVEAALTAPAYWFLGAGGVGGGSPIGGRAAPLIREATSRARTAAIAEDSALSAGGLALRPNSAAVAQTGREAAQRAAAKGVATQPNSLAPASSAFSTGRGAASALPLGGKPGSTLLAPLPGEEMFVGDWLNLNLEHRLNETTIQFIADPHAMAKLVPPSIPYRAVPQFGGFVIEYGLKASVEADPILSRILQGVPQASQMVRGGAPDLVLRAPFAGQWGLKPWDVTTSGAAAYKAARGVDYQFLIYQIDWKSLRL